MVTVGIDGVEVTHFWHPHDQEGVDMGRGGPTILSVIATGLQVSVDWLYLCKYSYLYTFICRMVVSEMNYLFEL